MRLTDATIKAFEAPAAGYKIHHDDGISGFGLRVTANGVKSFVLMHGMPRHRVTLGQYPQISLSDARTVARRMLAENTLRRHFPGRIAFSEALERFVAEKEQKNRARTVADHKRILNKYFAPLLRKNLDEISTDDITRIVDSLRKTPSTALHAFWSMRTFLRWCVRRRYIQHSPIEGLESPTPIVRRERVLSDDELRRVWMAAVKLGGTFGSIVQLLILTGQRKGEISALKAEWIGEDMITLPSEITKNKRAHTFPITPRIKALARPFKIASFDLGKTRLDELSGVTGWVLHDLRRTYATNLQRLGVKLEVIESLLNHVSGTRAGIVGTYQRHRYEAEMREAVALYEEWFAKLAESEK